MNKTFSPKISCPHVPKHSTLLHAFFFKQQQPQAAPAPFSSLPCLTTTQRIHFAIKQIYSFGAPHAPSQISSSCSTSHTTSPFGHLNNLTISHLANVYWLDYLLITLSAILSVNKSSHLSNEINNTGHVGFKYTPTRFLPCITNNSNHITVIKGKNISFAFILFH